MSRERKRERFKEREKETFHMYNVYGNKKKKKKWGWKSGAPLIEVRFSFDEVKCDSEKEQ